LVRPWSGMIYFAFVVIPLVAVQTVTLRRKHVLLSNTPGTRAIAPCNNVTMYLGGRQGKGNIGYTSGVGELQELKNRKVEAEGEVRRGCSRQKNPKPWEPLGSRCGTLVRFPLFFGLSTQWSGFVGLEAR
jgi:hypothetical protein